MSKPIIEFERYAIIRKVMRVPDRRYKSGYRVREILSENTLFLPDGILGGDLRQVHMHKIGTKFEQTDAFAHVEFSMDVRSMKL